jgi:hypothetical protein
MFIYNLFSKTEAVFPDNIPVNYVTPKTGVQYRGSCQLIKGRSEINMGQIMSNPANIQIFYNNITNWDLIRIEDKNTLSSGKFVIISQNLESSAIVDWLVIIERGSPIEIPKNKVEEEVKKERPMTDLHKELLQRLNRRALDNKPIDLEIKPKKKEKTNFRKELLIKKQVIMNKRKLDRT